MNAKKTSQFENSFFIPQPREAKSITRFFLLCCLVVGGGFFSFQAYNYGFKKIHFHNLFIAKFRSQETTYTLSSKESAEERHTLPLFINLKGEDGPQLARVSVSIYLDSQKLKTSSGKKVAFEDLESQLLFLLSGQSITHLRDKDFQGQIQAQLNLFLSHQMIQDLNIETELLNQTGRSL